MERVIRAGLYENVNQIATDLIKLWKLEFQQEVEHLSNPLNRWLDFRLRYIDPIPRTIIYSNKFPVDLPPTVKLGLDTLIGKLTIGEDVNPYQSKRLTRFTDFSGKNRSRRTDLLWAEWGIAHLHITDIEHKTNNTEYYASRECSAGESWLLFCIINGKEIGLIDVRHHNDVDLFSDIELMKTMKASWPEYVEQFKLNGISPGNLFSNEQIGKLRNVGMAYGVPLDNAVYMGPGMGVTSASTPLKVSMLADKVLDKLDCLAKLICLEDGPLQSEITKLGVNDPKFELCLTPSGVRLCETVSNIGFIFPRREELKSRDMSLNFDDLFCPMWAIAGLKKVQNFTEFN